MTVEPRALLFARRSERIDRVVADRIASVTVVLEGVHDPHNLAAVLRTAEALGLCAVHVIAGPRGFSPAPAVTQGADKWLAVHRHAGPAAAARLLRSEGFALYASLLAGEALSLDRLPAAGKMALVLGNEHDGVSPPMAALCDGAFRIPMHGFTRSFNVSVAAAIALHAAVSARRRGAEGGDLDGPSREALRRRYEALAVKQHRRLPWSANGMRGPPQT